MKRIIFIVAVLAINGFGTLKAQVTPDLGLMPCVSTYYGELNRANPVYNASPSFMGFLRLNLSSRYAVRMNAAYVVLNGDASAEDYQYYGQQSFSSTLMEISPVFEINFLPFVHGNAGRRGKKKEFTPYVNGGVGAILSFGGGPQQPISVVFPLGFGMKMGLTRRITLGVEYGIRKTLIDDIDGGLSDYSVETPAIYNNKDWYQLIGANIAIRLGNVGIDCPVYD